MVMLRMLSSTLVNAQSLTDAQVSVVGQRLAEGASHRRVCSLLDIRNTSPDHVLKAGSTVPVPKFSWSTTPRAILSFPLPQFLHPNRFPLTCQAV